MEHDIVIAGSMALASVIAALGLLWRIARAVREEPKLAAATPAIPSGTAPALPPTQGW